MIFKVEIKAEYDSEGEAQRIVNALSGLVDAEIVDITPCEAVIWHGPGHQSKTHCEITGPHDIHGCTVMGEWSEWTDKEADDDGRVYTL